MVTLCNNITVVCFCMILHKITSFKASSSWFFLSIHNHYDYSYII